MTDINKMLEAMNAASIGSVKTFGEPLYIVIEPKAAAIAMLENWPMYASELIHTKEGSILYEVEKDDLLKQLKEMK